jgi:hypothetical protein
MLGSGGCLSRSFSEPATKALLEVCQQLQHRSEQCCKLLQDIESVLRLLKGPCSLSIMDDDKSNHEGCQVLDTVQQESSDELEEI